jgi:hypothetical protein
LTDRRGFNADDVSLANLRAVPQVERPKMGRHHVARSILVTHCVTMTWMIKTFRDQDTENLFARQISKKFLAKVLILPWGTKKFKLPPSKLKADPLKK